MEHSFNSFNPKQAVALFRIAYSRYMQDEAARDYHYACAADEAFGNMMDALNDLKTEERHEVRQVCRFLNALTA